MGEIKIGMRGHSNKEPVGDPPIVHPKHLEEIFSSHPNPGCTLEGSPRAGREDGKPLRKRVKFNDGKGESSHGVRGKEGGSMGGMVRAREQKGFEWGKSNKG